MTSSFLVPQTLLKRATRCLPKQLATCLNWKGDLHLLLDVAARGEPSCGWVTEDGAPVTEHAGEDCHRAVLYVLCRKCIY
jgi:hypothetical protein